MSTEDEHHCPMCDSDKMTQKNRRWQEVCQCFRMGYGQVTTVEASRYLRRGKLFFRDLVKMGIIPASIETNHTGPGFLYWIEIKDAINAVRTPINDK